MTTTQIGKQRDHKMGQRHVDKRWLDWGTIISNIIFSQRRVVAAAAVLEYRTAEKTKQTVLCQFHILG
jgi:hypothetical protein